MSTTQQAGYPPTPRTTPTRLRERAGYDEQAVHAVLDEALFCHLGFVVDGEPVVLPTIHARVGPTLYLHASTGARLVRSVPDDGIPVCVTVTLLDGLVLARSHFHHSMNYRSVVAHGRATLVRDPAERAEALAAIVEHVAPGRAAVTRGPDAQELAATAVLRLSLAEVSLKMRTGPPIDDEPDLGLPHWAGVLPVNTSYGPPASAPDLIEAAAELPEHLRGYRRPGGPVTPATTSGAGPGSDRR
jgi:nitroimidazol reductase NimA-like FMN-containing flavoprotein (pyridoxamine 5'-phosphate oxidase superfamily)